MVEINWTHESERWLQDIFDYIARDNPVAAAQTLTNIYKKAQLLKKHPRLGYRYALDPSREIRILLYRHYRIVYLLKSDDVIDILGVFHGALEIERYVQQLEVGPE